MGRVLRKLTTALLSDLWKIERKVKKILKERDINYEFNGPHLASATCTAMIEFEGSSIQITGVNDGNKIKFAASFVSSDSIDAIEITTTKDWN